MPLYEVEVAREGDETNAYKVRAEGRTKKVAEANALKGFLGGMVVIGSEKIPEEHDEPEDERDEDGFTAAERAFLEAEIERRVAAAEDARLAGEAAEAREREDREATDKAAEAAKQPATKASASK